jgi:MFS family permease
MALVFAATIANRWFVRRRGLVMGVLTAAGATGQLIFLPVMAALTERQGWRTASLVVTFAALAVVPFVVLVLRDYPRTEELPRTVLRRVGRNRGKSTRPEPRAGRCVLWPRRHVPGRSGLGRWLRNLRRHDQRSDRHPLRTVRP